MDNITTYTASEARENLYKLIKLAAKGLNSYEIKLRGEPSVVLISKDELDSWLETLDILSNPTEIKTIRIAKKEKGSVSHKNLLQKLT